MSIAKALLFALLVSLTAGQSDASQPSDYVILSFTAKWCQPCNAMSPALERISEQGWLVRQIDVDREKDLVQRWKVTHLPTIVILQQGRELDRTTGEIAYQDLMLRLPKVEPLPIRSTTLVSFPQPDAIAPSPSKVDPMHATVRIRIEDGQSTSFGSGTIVDQHGEEALVLTCGHLFRDSKADSKITIDAPFDGRLVTLPATVVDFRCDETDIGLIAFRPGRPVAVAPLLPRGVVLKEREKVASFGCDQGADPSRRDSHITKLNRYLGPSNVEVAKAPIQGRSGGGLFNSQGQLIGVCYAADSELDEGLYSGPDVVYSQLERLGLGRLYNTPPVPKSIAAAPPPVASGSAMQSVAATVVPNSTTIDAFPDQSKGDGWKSTIEQAAKTARESAANSVASVARAGLGTTLIAILRDPQGREQQITIPSPSPALLQALHSHSQAGATAAPVAIR